MTRSEISRIIEVLHHCFVNTSRTAMPWEQGFWMPSLSWLGYTGFLSQWRAKLCDWAVRPVRAGCYPWAALTLVNSKTLYNVYSTFYCHGIPNIVSLAQRHLMNHWMYEKGCKKGRAKKAPNDGICFWLWFIISQHSPLLLSRSFSRWRRNSSKVIPYSEMSRHCHGWRNIQYQLSYHSWPKDSRRELYLSNHIELENA